MRRCGDSAGPLWKRVKLTGERTEGRSEIEEVCISKIHARLPPVASIGPICRSLERLCYSENRPCRLTTLLDWWKPNGSSVSGVCDAEQANDSLAEFRRRWWILVELTRGSRAGAHRRLGVVLVRWRQLSPREEGRGMVVGAKQLG